jgi:hypothetical protein
VGGISDAKPTAEQTEQILEIVDRHAPAHVDLRTLMWLVRGCEELWGPRAEALLAKIARDGGDESGVGEITYGNKDREQPDWKRALELGGELSTKAINSARGIALALIGGRAWSSPEQFARYRSLLDEVVGAPAEPHIHAAFDRLILSGLKHDLACGIDWTLRIARVAPEALLAGNGQRILGWIGERDTVAFAELAGIFLTHEDVRMRAFAALIIAQRRLDDAEWQPLIDTLLESGRESRAAIAAVAAANFKTTRFGSIATQWLLHFFDDEDELVRKEATDCFRRMGAEGMRTHAGLFEAYAGSRHFSTGGNYFLFQLKDAPAALDEMTLGLLEKALGATTDEARAARSHDLHYAGDLLLRVYASNLDSPERIARTLDLIDQLVELGLIEPAKLDLG